MKILGLDDVEQVLSDGRTSLSMGYTRAVEPWLNALEWAVQRIKKLEEDIRDIGNSLEDAHQDAKEADTRLTALQKAAEKALGYLTPSSSAWEILNDALQDSKE